MREFLKPTGANYNKTARYKQGEAFYTLGYGFWITAIASAKLAMMKKKTISLFGLYPWILESKKSKNAITRYSRTS